MKLFLHYSATLLDGSRSSDEMHRSEDRAELVEVARGVLADPAAYGVRTINLWITDDSGETVWEQ